MAVRDFIPVDSEPSPEERARFMRSGGIDLTRVVPDFIPVEGAAPFVDRTAQEKEDFATSLALAAQDHKVAIADELAEAKARLEKMDAQEAVAFISDCSPHMQQVYVTAEAQTKGRKTVLSRFSTVDFIE